MAYILARCPRSVRRVRICIRLSGSTFAVATSKLVSAAAFLASYKHKTKQQISLLPFSISRQDGIFC